MSDDHLNQLGVAEAAARIAEGQLSARALVEAHLARIKAREPVVGAWAYLDPEAVRKAADLRDEERARGHGVGPLHGVPIGIKDIIDTADTPTENGTVIHAGRRPQFDASCVAALRDAGAIILGKTVTTELAVFAPGKTRNPHDPERTPGGSSSGSAAAVADAMVPAALGTQTAGSVIRPASFCGVFGYKPTFGLIARVGCLEQSAPLDTIGLFARSVEDLALVADCLTASDSRDPASYPRSRPPLHRLAMSRPPARPMFAFVKTPKWSAAEPDTQAAFAELVAALGDRVDEVTLPDVFAEAWQWQRILQMKDIARNYGPLFAEQPEKASAKLRELMEEGARYSDEQYNSARTMQDVIYAGLERIFERYDAILTPAAPGPAPKGLESTGDPVFNALWTYAGVPAVSLPLLEVDGMPLGVQLVGPRRDDGRLLRTARSLVATLREEGGEGVALAGRDDGEEENEMARG